MNQYPNNNTKTTTTNPSTSNTTTRTHHQQYYPQQHYNALFSSNGSSGGGGGGGPRPTPTITTLNTSSSVGVMGVGVDERLRHLLTTVPESALSSAHWVSRTGRSSSFSTSTPLIPPRPPHLSSSSTTTPRMPPPRRHPSSIFSSSSTNSTPYQTPHPPPPHPNISSSSPLMPPPPPPPPKVPHSSSSSFFPTLLHSSASTMDSSVLAPPPGSTHILNSGMGGGRKRPMAPPSASTSSSTTTPAPPPRPPLPPQPPPLDLSDDLAAQGHLSMDEEPSQVLMSLSWTRGKLGAAFYDVTTEQVYVVEDKVEAAPDFWVLRCLFREQRPRCMLVGGRQDQRLFEVLRELCGGAVGVPSPYNNNKHTPPQAGGGGDGGGGVAGRRTTTTTNNTTNNSTSPSSSTTSFTSSSSSCHLRILPMGDFKYELCVRRVLSLSLPGEPEGATEGERELFVRGLVNTHLRAMTRALGALLRFLDVHGAEIAAPGHLLEATPVLGIHVYVMEDMAQLDEATAVALQVFSEEQHPAASKSGKPSASKEGLSLYALLSRTACPMARHTLRRVLLRPLVEVGALEGRYAAVGWGVDSANMDTLKQLQACLRHVSNVSYTVGRLQRGQLGVRDWKVLYKSLFNAILIGEICQAQDQDIPIFKQTGEALTEGLYRATFLIQRIMDVDQSEREGRFVVKPGVDVELDERKRRFSGLGEVMRRVAAVELTRLPEEVESCCMIYLPHVGYLLAFPPPKSLLSPGPDATADTTAAAAAATSGTHPAQSSADSYALPGLHFMFKTPDMVFYKSDTCYELDRELGDIQVEIANHETRIMLRLMDALLQHAHAFLALVGHALMLDCFLAFSIVTRECGWVRPEIVEEGEAVIEVEGARHPLQELCTPSFVANPVRSGGGGGGGCRPSITLITGPNASGKTVYLKQVGVLVVLAQVGCWVPATRARLTPVDAIIAVTPSTPSITSGLSTFMAELNRMSSAVLRATSRSLVLVDEFGAVTYENDGASLLTACLDHWGEMASGRRRRRRRSSREEDKEDRGDENEGTRRKRRSNTERRSGSSGEDVEEEDGGARIRKGRVMRRMSDRDSGRSSGEEEEEEGSNARWRRRSEDGVKENGSERSWRSRNREDEEDDSTRIIVGKEWNSTEEDIGEGRSLNEDEEEERERRRQINGGRGGGDNRENGKYHCRRSTSEEEEMEDNYEEEGRGRGRGCPHVFVSTHLLRVYDHLKYPETVCPLVLEVVREGGGLVPLYQARTGRAHTSHAAAVAALAGVPQCIIERAGQVCESIRRGRQPPRWTLMEDEGKMRVCQDVVTLFLTHDPDNDPLNALLKIREFCSSSSSSASPSYSLPSSSHISRPRPLAPPPLPPPPPPSSSSVNQSKILPSSLPPPLPRPPPPSLHHSSSSSSLLDDPSPLLPPNQHLISTNTTSTSSFSSSYLPPPPPPPPPHSLHPKICDYSSSFASSSSSSAVNPLPPPPTQTFLSPPPRKKGRKVGEGEGEEQESSPHNASLIPQDFLEVIIASGGVTDDGEENEGSTHARTWDTHTRTRAEQTRTQTSPRTPIRTRETYTPTQTEQTHPPIRTQDTHTRTQAVSTPTQTNTSITTTTTTTPTPSHTLRPPPSSTTPSTSTPYHSDYSSQPSTPFATPQATSSFPPPLHPPSSASPPPSSALPYKAHQMSPSITSPSPSTNTPSSTPAPPTPTPRPTPLPSSSTRKICPYSSSSSSSPPPPPPPPSRPAHQISPSPSSSSSSKRPNVSCSKSPLSSSPSSSSFKKTSPLSSSFFSSPTSHIKPLISLKTSLFSSSSSSSFSKTTTTTTTTTTITTCSTSASSSTSSSSFSKPKYTHSTKHSTSSTTSSSSFILTKTRKLLPSTPSSSIPPPSTPSSSSSIPSFSSKNPSLPKYRNYILEGATAAFEAIRNSQNKENEASNDTSTPDDVKCPSVNKMKPLLKPKKTRNEAPNTRSLKVLKPTTREPLMPLENEAPLARNVTRASKCRNEAMNRRERKASPLQNRVDGKGTSTAKRETTTLTNTVNGEREREGEQEKGRERRGTRGQGIAGEAEGATEGGGEAEANETASKEIRNEGNVKKRRMLLNPKGEAGEEETETNGTENTDRRSRKKRMLLNPNGKTENAEKETDPNETENTTKHSRKKRMLITPETENEKHGKHSNNKQEEEEEEEENHHRDNKGKEEKEPNKKGDKDSERVVDRDSRDTTLLMGLSCSSAHSSPESVVVRRQYSFRHQEATTTGTRVGQKGK